MFHFVQAPVSEQTHYGFLSSAFARFNKPEYGLSHAARLAVRTDRLMEASTSLACTTIIKSEKFCLLTF